MTSSRARIQIPRDRIVEFCRRHHIHRLALFGSVLRDDFTPASDVDVLVEFEPGKTPGFAFFRMQDELSDIIGRRVDLNTPKELSKYFREEVLSDIRSTGVIIRPGVQARWPVSNQRRAGRFTGLFGRCAFDGSPSAFLTGAASRRFGRANERSP